MLPAKVFGGAVSDKQVKLDKLVKSLRRDLAANPLKASVLGVLLLAGLYFWGPLVWRWTGMKGRSVAITTETNILSNAPLASTQGGYRQGETTVSAVDWDAVQKRREQDPFVKSADFFPKWNRVFGVAETAEAPMAQPAEVKSPAPPIEVKPQEVGLVLGGVAIGPRMKRAIINGKVYRETEMVTARRTTDELSKKGNKELVVSFRLVRIARRTVELERNGKTYQLEIATPDSGTTKSLGN